MSFIVFKAINSHITFNRNHTHTSNFTNQQTITQNFKQKIWITFRFVSFLSQRFVRFDDIQWIRYNDHQKACVVLFDFLHFRNHIFNENEFITSQQRYENKWHEKMKNNNQCEFVARSNQFVFFAISCQSSIRQHFAQNLQSIKTRRLIKIRKIQIREIWNNIRLRNNYRFAVFASILFEKSIDFLY